MKPSLNLKDYILPYNTNTNIWNSNNLPASTTSMKMDLYSFYILHFIIIQQEWAFKLTFFRMPVFLNRNISKTVHHISLKGKIKIIPDSPCYVSQWYKVIFVSLFCFVFNTVNQQFGNYTAFPDWYNVI